MTEVLRCFTGCISQIPPMFSAIKQAGQPLYKLARQGIVVERKPRQVEMFSLELMSFEPPLVSLRVTCSRGAYIRSLADDIGAALGCGASLQNLCRIASGAFHLSAAISLENLEEHRERGTLHSVCLTPFSALGHLPDFSLTDSGYAKVIHGRPPAWQDIIPPSAFNVEQTGLVRLSCHGVLAAVAQIVSAGDGPNRFVLKRVFA